MVRLVGLGRVSHVDARVWGSELLSPTDAPRGLCVAVSDEG